MKEYTLVVVDMQPDFPASKDPATLAAVQREVKRAMHFHCPVVLLEVPYFSPLDEEGYKPTHRSIMQLLSGYDRYQVVQKIFSDGSLNVINTCEWKKYGTKRFRVCGVNTDLCVLETVLGLARRLPESTIKVVQDACNTSYDKNCWEQFTVHPNIVLKPTSKMPAELCA
ncbi:MAG TPA: isochorismatase family protein [Candidatus Obscuribacterales bacterium]